MIGEHLIGLRQALGVQFFDGHGDQPMQLFTALPEQAVIGHVVGQSVLEHVHQFGVEAALVDELQYPQFLEETFELRLHVRDALQETDRKLAPDDRGEL